MEKLTISIIKYTFTPDDYLLGDPTESSVIVDKVDVTLDRCLALMSIYNATQSSDETICHSSFFTSISPVQVAHRQRPTSDLEIFSLGLHEIDDMPVQEYQLREISNLVRVMPRFH